MVRESEPTEISTARFKKWSLIIHGVDEQNLVAARLRLGGAADDDAGFHGRVVEEVWPQAEDALDGVGLDELAPYVGLLLAEEHAVRRQDSTAASLGRQALHNVGPEGIVCPALRRGAVEVTAPGVGGESLTVPLLDGIGRIGQHHVEAHQAVTLHQLGLGEGVAALDAEILDAMEEAVRTSDGGGHQVALLPVEAHVAPLLSLSAQVRDA
jgi:hypothetical protein